MRTDEFMTCEKMMYIRAIIQFEGIKLLTAHIPVRTICKCAMSKVDKLKCFKSTKEKFMKLDCEIKRVKHVYLI